MKPKSNSKSKSNSKGKTRKVKRGGLGVNTKPIEQKQNELKNSGVKPNSNTGQKSNSNTGPRQNQAVNTTKLQSQFESAKQKAEEAKKEADEAKKKLDEATSKSNPGKGFLGFFGL